jgi:hypothetical protein
MNEDKEHGSTTMLVCRQRGIAPYIPLTPANIPLFKKDSNFFWKTGLLIA